MNTSMGSRGSSVASSPAGLVVAVAGSIPAASPLPYEAMREQYAREAMADHPDEFTEGFAFKFGVERDAI